MKFLTPLESGCHLWIILGVAFHLSSVSHGESSSPKQKQKQQLQNETPERPTVYVPPFVERGQNATLKCFYTMKPDDMKVSWYFEDTKEIYKYQSKATVFNNTIGMFEIDEDASTVKNLVLRNLTLNATGMYHCKVILDDFKIHEDKQYMKVGVIPKESPSIGGDLKNESNPGSSVNMTCTSAPSLPMADLTWYINGEEAKPEYTKIYNVTYTPEKLAITKLGLQLNLSKTHFIKKQVIFNCTAEIHLTNYSMSQKHNHRQPASGARRNSGWTGAFFLFFVAGLKIR